ncbi:MAG: outer rane autotransporter barrel protein, partial [Candidatus Kaiserbacteria bacterium]|nr:outer rane autotransporter barrel protein [Candidatus Kaiserbacteria bacterium]
MNPLFKPSRRSFRLAMVLLSGSALAGVPLLSAALAETWTGATSTDWFTASNWDTNTVPTAATSGVTIATLTPNATVINGGNAFSGGGLFVGEVTPGSLTISNGGTFNNTSGLVIIGSNGGAGTMSVTGVGSTLISPQGIEVALGSNGTLGIANGASVSSDSLIMAGTGGISLVTVDGAGSLLSIGSLGMIEGPLFSPPASATLAITNGAHVMDSGTADIGNDVGQATITVDGTGSLFQGAGTITIGDYVNGAVAVTNGGVVSGGADIVIAGTSVNAPNAIGTVTVDGAGSQMNAVGNIIVGNYGTGSLTVRNGAQIDAVDLIAGYFPGSNGTAVITGTGSTAILTAAVAGLEGAGSLSVLNGATLGAMAYDIGIGGGTGVGVVDGPGSLVAASDHLAVGAIGSNGTLTISNGGIINDTGYADIGYTGGGTGTVTVRDENSALNVTGNLVVGSGGAGTLILTNGGTFSGSTVDLGVTAGSQGTLSISTNGSIATATALTIGDAGTGLLSLDNFGALTTATAVVGAQSGSTGTALVANASGGGHTTLETTQDLIVGRDSGATGSVTLSNFGQVESDGTIEVGESAGATGTITSTGTGALLISGSNLSIGEGGTGTVNIQAGSGAYAEALTYIGHQQGATGTLSVDGAGSIFNAFGNLSIGGDDANATGGNGSVSVTNGGTIAAQQFILIGGSAGSTGTVTVSGTGSNITGTSLLAVGDQGTGTLSVLNGATVTDLVGNIGNQGSGTATVDGAGSSLVLSSLFTVGNFGSGILTVSNGGAISSGDLYVGGGAGVSGLVTVTDAGSTMTGDGVVNIGYQGAGDLILQAGGVFVAPGGVTIAAQAGSSGEIEIGANFANPAAAPGVLSTPTVTFGAGDGTLVFNHTSSQYAFAPTITGLGEILTLAGVTDLTANSSGFAGTANVQGGTLLVDGTLGGNGVSVEAAGTFGGKGTVTNVTVADGGTLLGVEGQTLNMTSLSLSNGSNVNVTLGAPGGAGLFAVSQSITLDGVLNITAATGFNAGVYRLVDYGGALTDNGLDIGATPSGTAASDFVVQTSVAGQVNLVDSHASILNFWDGAAAGSANNGAIDGGNGVWSVTVPNWTDVNGQSNGAMAPQPGFAVFEAAPGTVTVDDSAGAVSVTGMQFASSGYTVTGDAITLASGAANIRVGDGTAAGAGYSATIASVLTGDGTLIKTDLGTLILTGANTYTGGTSINAGTLQIGNGGTTGSIVGDINLNGTLIFDRSDVMNFNSRIFSNNAIVIQAGSGTTILGTSQSYSGQTIISAGTLQGASASFGSSSILDNATLMINQATDAVFANVISGAGTFIKQGAGTLALVGASDFTGTTDIEQGTLQIGAGGTDGSITGNILDNATLSFDRSDAVAFGGVISGSGSVTKAGNG